jgi:integrase
MAAKVRMIKGVYWVVVHHGGRRRKKRIGKDRRTAEEVARQIQARLTLGEFAMRREAEATIPFDQFAEEWLRREVEIPIERDLADHLAPGTAGVYRLQVDVHLRPYFGSIDVRKFGLHEVQGFHDHCIDTGRPKSAKSIEMALNALRLVLNHARARGLIESNAVEIWKRRRPRRRSSSVQRVRPDKVLSAAKLQELLSVAQRDFPRFYPLILFLADTGTRLGEATALRWEDVDLESRTARICRSFSSGERLGPTKTGRERVVELSSRLCRTLAEVQPNVFPILEGTLVFANRSGGLLCDTYFRNKVFSKAVRSALGASRRFSPHCLRHTWASLHMARGTPLKWIQDQGGWTTAKVLLDTYGHFMPTETRGFADALAAPPDGPPAAPASRAASGGGAGSGLTPRPPITSEIVVTDDRPQIPDHALHRAAALLEKLGYVDSNGCDAALADLAEEVLRDSVGHEEERLAPFGSMVFRCVGEGVRRVAFGVGGRKLDDRIAQRLFEYLPALDRDSLPIREQKASPRAKGAERRVAVVVGFEGQLDADDALAAHDVLKQWLDTGIGAEAVDSFPGRDGQGGDEALGLDAAVGEEIEVAHREEVGLAFEAETLFDVEGGDACLAECPGVGGLFAGAGRQQIGEMEALLFCALRDIHVFHEARVGGVDASRPFCFRCYDEHPDAVILQGVTQTMPLLDGALAVDVSACAPARAGVGVGAALHAEVGGVTHQDGSHRGHWRGKPGGSVSGSRGASLSMWAWGVAQ